MHKPFVPVPDWLVPANHQSSDLQPKPDSTEFIFLTFQTLYGLGMSDRQVVELTSVFIWQNSRDLFHVPLIKTPELQNVSWYVHRSKFYLGCSSVDQKIRAWVEAYLPKNDLRSAPSQSFWAETKNWFGFFVDNLVELDNIIRTTKNRFVQRCLCVPETGVWDLRSVEACKKLQVEFPKSVMPWKSGRLDGFTYRFLARNWRRHQGC